MRVLFDNGTPRPIARALPLHQVTFWRDIGWHELVNGKLIQQAEQAGFNVLLTTDKNIRYQQNLKGRTIAIVVLSYPRWPTVRFYLDRIAAAIDSASPGSYTEVPTHPVDDFEPDSEPEPR